MKTTRYAQYSILGIIALTTFLFSLDNRRPVSYRVFHTEKGWGYDIFINQNTYIHQEIIPGMRDNRGFLREKQAKAVALLIITKLKENRIPLVSKFEIAEILKN